VAKRLIERDLSFFLHFFSVSTLKSVFGREDESAVLTKNTKCGKKSGIRQVRGAGSTSTILQDDCTVRRRCYWETVNGVSQITLGILFESACISEQSYCFTLR